MSKRSETQDATNRVQVTPKVPTVTIYQNPDYVSGILQQLYREPLVTADTVENVTSAERASGLTVDGDGDVSGQMGFFTNKAKIAGKIAAAADRTTTDSSSGKRTSRMEYTQAYYLHIVREFLRESDQLQIVNSLREAQSLQVGDLVEYSATFTPDRMAVFLDVLTPELIAAIVARNIRNTAIKGIDWTDYDQRTSVLEKTRHQVQMETEFAHSVTEAVRTDFRSDKTREFFAAISNPDAHESVTAITICDNSHFAVEDTDRILDGRYTVLGKVTDTIAEDRPALERNKLLSSIPPESWDVLVGEMRGHLDGALERAKMTGEVAFDPRLNARVTGASFKVIPIAIYV